MERYVRDVIQSTLLAGKTVRSTDAEALEPIGASGAGGRPAGKPHPVDAQSWGRIVLAETAACQMVIPAKLCHGVPQTPASAVSVDAPLERILGR